MENEKEFNYKFWYGATLSMIKHYAIGQMIINIGTVVTLYFAEKRIWIYLLLLFMIILNLWLWAKSKNKENEEKIRNG